MYIVSLISLKISHSSNYDNSHALAVQINVKAPSDMVMIGGGLTGRYVFEQMHFHWGSEHTLDGRRYALELHMVHRNADYSLAEAVHVKNGIAVLGVLFHAATIHNEQLDAILANVADIADKAGATAELKDQLIVGGLLPRNMNSYFRYEGSLTTPSCNEAVIWTVFTQSLPCTFEQMNKFKMLKTANGSELVHNYRQVQPLNARSLVYVSSAEGLDSAAFTDADDARANQPIVMFTILLVICCKVFMQL